jgi:hypothetical protein
LDAFFVAANGDVGLHEINLGPVPVDEFILLEVAVSLCPKQKKHPKSLG